jgi:hypothetical protein
VNFTDLQRWSAPHATTLRLISQRDFLLPFASPADAALMDEHGAGGAFLVLEQASEKDAPPVDHPAKNTPPFKQQRVIFQLLIE